MFLDKVWVFFKSLVGRPGIQRSTNWNSPVAEELAEKVSAKDVLEKVRENKGGAPKYIWPIKNKVVTSPFGSRMLTYDGEKHSAFHYGVDLIGDDYSVKSPEDMEIKKVLMPDRAFPCKFVKRKGAWNRVAPPEGKKWNDGSWGWTPYVVGVGTYSKVMYVFRHVDALVAPGQSVAVGDLVGYYGNLGFSQGAHLHFETYEFVIEMVGDTHWPVASDPIILYRRRFGNV